MSDSHWDSMSVEFRVEAATIVAMFPNCSVLTESSLSLSVQEGRLLTYYGETDDDDQDEATLEYKCIITASSSAVEQAAMREARINIDGTHENGRRLTIKGEGWAGHDGDGLIEVIFDEPPVMVVYDCPLEFESDVPEAGAGDNVVSLWQPSKDIG